MPASGARTTFLILGLLIASTTNAAGSSSSGCSLAGSLAPPGDEKWAPVSHLPLPLITLSNATTSAAAATASTSTGTSDASGRRLIFVRRMRKAGSTSLRAFFAALGKARGWDVQANEFLAFNGKCVGNPFVRAQVLLVAHLRDPLQRLNSEFFYVGPGSSRGGLKPSDEHTWASWMNASAARKAEGTFEGLIRGGLYLDNLYVRALTGDCAAACLPGDGEHADAGGGDADINRGGGTGGGGGSSALAGGAAPRLSGCRLCRRKVCGEGVPGFRPTLGSADLVAARSALDHFDLVVRARDSRVDAALLRPAALHYVVLSFPLHISFRRAHARACRAASP